MPKLRRIIALSLGLAVLTPRLAHAGPEVPPPEAGAGDPTAPETWGPSTPDPAAAPAAAPTTAPSNVEIRSALPPKPGYNGKGLLIAAGAVTAFGWASRFVALGVGLSLISDCANTTTCNEVTKGQVVGAFSAIAPISQIIATGLVIPGGVLKGRSDGWGYVTSGKPDRDGRAFLIAGAVLFGVFTAGSIALRPAVLLGCATNITGCGGTGAYAGYMIGVQVSDTLSTAGAGLMSYGLAYQNFRKTNAPKVAFAPWSSRGTYGLSLSGRF